MKKAALVIALGLILVSAAGYFVAPDFSADLINRLPFIGGTSGPVSLTYWGLWEEKQVIQPLIDEYQRQNPNVTINYEMRDPRNHLQTLRSRLAAGGAPDIVRVHSTWVPYLVNDLAPIEAKVLDTATYEQIFYPANEQFLKYDGTYYGLPLMIDGLALVYNQDLLTRAGLSRPPQTWDKFREAVRGLTRYDTSGRVVQSGAALGFARNVDYFSDILGLMLAQNGVSFVDAGGNVNFHNSISPDGRNLGAEALQFFSLFALSERSWNPTWENSTQAFANGKVAMVFVPSHRVLQILNQQPDFAVGVAPVPQLPNVSQGGGVTWANYWVEVVPKASQNTRAAWEFLNWLTQKEQLAKFYRTASDLRPFGEPYPRSDLAQDLATDQYTYPYVQQADRYTSWYFNYGTYDGVLNERVVQALQTAVENVANGNDPAAELGNAAAQAQQALGSL